MKKKATPTISRRNSKREIIKWARNGSFDDNPLLTNPHNVTCKSCGFSEKTTYLDHLKAGKFEIGEIRTIAVSYAAPTILGLSHAIEKTTPITMTIPCDRCGAEISCSPVSLEYLFFTTTRKQKLKNMYV